MRNLFGDTDAVHVTLDENGDIELNDVVKGDTVCVVVHYVQYSADKLISSLRKDVGRAVRAGKVTLEDARQLVRVCSWFAAFLIQPEQGRESQQIHRVLESRSGEFDLLLTIHQQRCTDHASHRTLSRPLGSRGRRRPGEEAIDSIASLQAPLKDFRCEFEGTVRVASRTPPGSPVAEEDRPDSFSGMFLWRKGGGFWCDSFYESARRSPKIERRTMFVRSQDNHAEEHRRFNDAVDGQRTFGSPSIFRARPIFEGPQSLFLI